MTDLDRQEREEPTATAPNHSAEVKAMEAVVSRVLRDAGTPEARKGPEARAVREGWRAHRQWALAAAKTARTYGVAAREGPGRVKRPYADIPDGDLHLIRDALNHKSVTDRHAAHIYVEIDRERHERTLTRDA
jgi:hypothetical protein